jgi:hypothetical protein
MAERGGRLAGSDAVVPGSLLTFGVMWSPGISKHRKITQKLLTPRNRTSGWRPRRSWQRAQRGAAYRTTDGWCLV